MSGRNFTSLAALFLLIFLFSSSPLSACFTGTVKDLCTGEPLANYPIQYQSNGSPSFFNTIYTDSNGGFSYSGAVGSSIKLGPTTYTFNGGGCRTIGTVFVYALTGLPAIGDVTLHQGIINSLPTAAFLVSGCTSNLLQFAYMGGGIDISKHCVKIEIFQGTSLSPIKIVDWTFFADEPNIPAINFNDIMQGLPLSAYRLRISIKCCGAKDSKDVNGFNVFSGNFNWRPEVSVDDAEFNWTGSAITEMVNMDGNIDNLHPNNGNIWQLGAASVGVAWLNALVGSNAVQRIDYKIERRLACDESVVEQIYQASVFPTNGQQVSNLNFNTLTTNYFSLNGPSITTIDPTTGLSITIPNTFFGVRYIYDDCFKFTVTVFGAPQCPPKEFSGIFMIYGLNTSARGLADSEGELGDWLGESISAELEKSLGLRGHSASPGLTLFPNPTTGQIKIEGLLDQSAYQLYDQAGKPVNAPFHAGFLDLGQASPGIYLLRAILPNKQVETHKIVKLP